MVGSGACGGDSGRRTRREVVATRTRFLADTFSLPLVVVPILYKPRGFCQKQSLRTRRHAGQSSMRAASPCLAWPGRAPVPFFPFIYRLNCLPLCFRFESGKHFIQISSDSARLIIRDRFSDRFFNEDHFAGARYLSVSPADGFSPRRPVFVFLA